MAFRIDRCDRPEDYVEFEMEDKNGKVVDFSIQKVDCYPPAVVKKINDFLAAQDATATVPDLNRETLKIVAPEHKKVFDGMTARQLEQVWAHLNEESGVSVGESEASTD